MELSIIATNAQTTSLINNQHNTAYTFDDIMGATSCLFFHTATVFETISWAH